MNRGKSLRIEKLEIQGRNNSNSNNNKRPATSNLNSTQRDYKHKTITNYYNEFKKISFGFKANKKKEKVNIWEYNKNLIAESLKDVNKIQHFMSSIGKI